MRIADENRANNYIKKHRNNKRWLAFALCVAFITGNITLYLLNKPATAMTEDGAKQVGLVLETADDEFEMGLIEQMNENKSDAQEDIEVTEDTDEEVIFEVSEEGSGDLEDEETSETREENFEVIPEDETETDETDSASSEDASAEGSSVKKTSKVTTKKVEIKEITLKATLVDEFGKELDAEKYTDIDLPSFENELALDDEENPPYENVKVKGKGLRSTTYSYVKATFSGKVITGIKKETKEVSETVVIEEVEEVASEADEEEVAESEDTAATEDSEEVEETAEAEEIEETTSEEEIIEAQTKEITVYSYTTDGETYTEFDESTVINFVYSQGTQAEYNYKDSNIMITAKLQVPGAIPDDAELVVKEITSSTKGYNYDAYLDALNDNAEAIADEAGNEEATEYTEENTLMYDIAFMLDGEEIQPAEGTVNISIEFIGKQLSKELSVEAEEDITVVHLPIKEEVKEAQEITNTEEATKITSDDIEVKTLVDATAEVSTVEKIEFNEDSFSVFAVTVYQKHASGADNFKTVLGDAVNFGIVADSLTVAESETNFAVKNATTANQFGNDLTNNCEQTFIAGSVTNQFKIKGFKAYFITPSEYTGLVTHQSGNEYLKFDTSYSVGELNKIVDDMLTYTRSASQDLAAKNSDIKLTTDKKDNQKYQIDITGLGAGTYYVTLTDKDFKDKINQAEKLRIYKNSDQVLVFNVTAKNTVNLWKFSVDVDGQRYYSDGLTNSKEYDKINQKIIWNFINAKEVHSAGSVVGIFISGRTDATFVNDSTSAGWIAFPNVVIKAGEWHNTYSDVQIISETAQMQAYKTIDGQYAEVSGFSFNLYKKDNSAADGWSLVQSVTNDPESPHNVIFDPIRYGGNSSNQSTNYQYTGIGNNQSETFIYKIVESEGAVDSDGRAYKADKTVYYAKVVVTKTVSEYTKTEYYRVDAPTYYTNPGCTKEYAGNNGDKLPVFNNKTNKGSVGVSLYKYLNGEDPGNHKFNFTVKVLNTRTQQFETITTDLTNEGKYISFTYDYNDSNVYNNSVFFLITENDITDKVSNAGISKDDDYILVRVANIGTDKQFTMFGKIDPTENEDFVKRLTGTKKTADFNKYYQEQIKSSGVDANTAGFNNTAAGMLRIHKMVVNDFGSDFVRNNTDSALLNNVVFRVTNNSTGNYIVVEGFATFADDKRTAYEYEANSHKIVAEYTVTYNRGAQWTIEGIPYGTYTVEEVADGLTIDYDASSNTSTVREGTNLSRVTKYDVTIDSNTSSTSFGTGGQNVRMVFSTDLKNHNDEGPDYVKVGTETPTVQVCNYYSNPVGPIEVTKYFSGSTWTDDMVFEFKIEPIGYYAHDSEGRSVTLESQPMPYGTDMATVSAADAVYDAETNTYRAVAQFEAIPYRFEGSYIYKITEVNGGYKGIKYDSSTYYVKVEVSKKYTKFSKTYTKERMVSIAKYNQTTTLMEDFYYLGADVTYASDEDFKNVLATCELHLETNPNTSVIDTKEFVATYSRGQDTVAFRNTLSGELTVNKIWLNADGYSDPDSHSSLTLQIWYRTVDRAGNKSEWKIYEATSIVLSQGNWSATVTGLPMSDEMGNTYEYCVKEPDEYLYTYQVTYQYGSIVSNANEQAMLEGQVQGRDTGYAMSIQQGNSYGSVTITNKTTYANELPHTGGSGTMPYAATGVGLIILAGLGMFLFGRNKRSTVG